MKLGIRQKIIFPAFLMLIIALGFVTVYSFILQRNAVNDLMKLTATEKLKELENGLIKSTESIELLETTLNKNFIRITKGVAAVIAADPTILEAGKIEKLIDQLGIDEIHVSDEAGILRWGNVPAFFGFDFASSQQSGVFMPALDSKDFEYAQQPQERGVDKVLFQYIGVSRIDKPGIIQIGVEPKELQSLIESSSLENTIKDIALSHSGYAILLNPDGIINAHTDSMMNGEDFSGTDIGEFFMSGQKEGKEIVGDYYAAFKTSNGWVYGVVYPSAEFTGSLQTYIISIAIAVILLLSASAVIFILLIGRIIKPLKYGVDFANEISNGNLDASLDVKSTDETGVLADALRNMLKNLNQVMARIDEVSEEIKIQSGEVSASTEDLSNGAAEQAASAEEVSASMEEMAASIKHNADNAQRTESLANRVSIKADESGQAVKDSIQAMEEIADRITIVEEIARQTNLLALNASIEAARAGEHGRGFAVVATEVGKLAQNSQDAARDINELSLRSMNVARTAGTTLEELLPEIRETASLVQQISQSSAEQENGVEQINTAILQLDNVIQTNASSAEELASTAQQLSDMAMKLNETMSHFRTGNKAAGSALREIETEPDSTVSLLN